MVEIVTNYFVLLSVPGGGCTIVSVLSNVHTLSPGLQQNAGAAALSLQSAAAESTAEVNIEHLVLPLSLTFQLKYRIFYFGRNKKN